MKKVSTQYSSRIGCDKIFESDIRFGYKGIIDRSIRFIENVQLKDRYLMELVAEQFACEPDDEDNGWRCEYWGKLMRGACKIYEYTRDEELYCILKDTVYILINAADKYGRISTYSIENEFTGWDMWGRKYVMLGLLHFYDICREESLKISVLETLQRHLDYIISKVGKNGKVITETSDMWQAVNSCSILEPVVRLYNITRNENYLNLAEHIVSCGMAKDCNLIELAYENKLYPYQYPVTKAYEIMSCFEGLIEYYRVTKISKYKEAAVNFVSALIDSEVTVIGCLGCRCEQFDNAKVTQSNDEHMLYMQETCVTVTWMKLCLQLYELTGDIKYAEQIEKSFYNAMLGAINTKLAENEIGVFPFESYSPLVIGHRGVGMGGHKKMGNYSYGCCAAIGAMGLGIIPFVSVMETQNGFVFNLYEEGNILLSTDSGNTVEIAEETEYPSAGRIVLRIKAENEERFGIRLRVPQFAQNAVVSVNGDKAAAEAGDYYTIDRVWGRDDTVKLVFDMNPGIIYSFDEEKSHICFEYGPIILARDLRFDSNTGKPAGKCAKYEYEIEDTDKRDYMLRIRVHADDETFDMIDYASAGKTLDEKSMMEAWISLN